MWRLHLGHQSYSPTTRQHFETSRPSKRLSQTCASRQSNACLALLKAMYGDTALAQKQNILVSTRSTTMRGPISANFATLKTHTTPSASATAMGATQIILPALVPTAPALHLVTGPQMNTALFSARRASPAKLTSTGVLSTGTPHLFLGHNRLSFMRRDLDITGRPWPATASSPI